MPSKRLFMNKLNFDEIKTPFSFIIQDFFYIFQFCPRKESYTNGKVRISEASFDKNYYLTSCKSHPNDLQETLRKRILKE